MIPENLRSLSELDFARLVRPLSPDERRIIRLRFGVGCEPQTLERVAETMGVTREVVRQSELRAMWKLGWIQSAN